MFTLTNHGWIGIDVGASTVKLAQVIRHEGRLKLACAAIVPRSRPWHQNGLADGPAVSAQEEIATLLASTPELSGRRAAALLPTSTCDFNTVSVVAGSETNQIAAMADEMAVLGIHLQRRVFDYWPGIRPGRNGQSDSQINVLSTSHAWSDRLSDDLADVGLDCQIIDGLPFTLSRCLAQAAGVPRAAKTAAIDWGYSGALFVLIDGGQPTYVRQLKQTALAQVHERIASELDLELHETVQLMRSVDVRTTDNEVAEVVAELLAPSIDVLVEEVERTLAHLNVSGSELSPQHIYLFGGGGTFAGIDQLLTRRLNRPVVTWRLDAEAEQVAVSKAIAMCMLGPAIALSALAWEAHP